MTDPIFSDEALFSAKFALDGLAKRVEVIGNNLANVDTPGFQAQALNFEQALSRATNQSAKLRLTASQSEHLAPSSDVVNMRTEPRKSGTWRTDGNNVNVDTELNQMAETGIRFQAMSQLISKKLLLLKTISQGR